MGRCFTSQPRQEVFGGRACLSCIRHHSSANGYYSFSGKGSFTKVACNQTRCA